MALVEKERRALRSYHTVEQVLRQLLEGFDRSHKPCSISRETHISAVWVPEHSKGNHPTSPDRKHNFVPFGVGLNTFVIGFVPKVAEMLQGYRGEDTIPHIIVALRVLFSNDDVRQSTQIRDASIAICVRTAVCQNISLYGFLPQSLQMNWCKWASGGHRQYIFRRSYVFL